jgi:hypothetical protein
VNVRPSGDTEFVSDTQAAVASPDEHPEFDEVEAWRFKCLLQAGWEMRHAEAIALDQAVDLHKACRMIKQGCSSELAFAILG